MNLYYEVYGCEMNKSQAYSLQRYLEKNNHISVNNIKLADIILIFTCSVRYTAEQRAIGRLHYFKYLKKEKPFLKVIILGCLSEQENKFFIEKKLADLVIGTINHHYVLEYLNSLENEKEKTKYDDYDRHIDYEKYFNLTTSSNNKIEFLNSYVDPKLPYKSFVTIIHGCSNYCSYCIVPYLRGKEVSRKKQEIIEDIENLAKNGVKEIVLLGQNVNAYGKDNNEYSFSELLTDISKIEGIELISFLSSHPKDFSDDLIEVVSSNPKVSKMVHLPLQSGSNKILQMMNRKYDIEKYLSIVEKLKNKNSDIQFSTDIIVGFPDETEDDFQNTLNIVKKVEYLDIFTYRYSQRKLKIIKYMDNISEEVKLDRLSRLIELKDQIGKEIRLKQIGKIKKAIIVDSSKLDENKKLFKTFDGFFGVIESDYKKGTIFEVSIKGISGNTLTA
ncbi:MAG TPA: tRNA (N6-isopentenyl adenosine(37)-C2)-methylthiotransferase MiaB [Exilispira sp.]|nr:tRNA (N6-isopentenyl adenosine(37)-C2)-methylthiotransferase MiaB [Exilispira sp.]